MYVFAEPVTDEQMEAIQSAKAQEIEAFEREVLGLEKHGGGGQAGHWDSLQAKVQAAVDQDEMGFVRDADGIEKDTDISHPGNVSHGENVSNANGPLSQGVEPGRKETPGDRSETHGGEYRDGQPHPRADQERPSVASGEEETKPVESRDETIREVREEGGSRLADVEPGNQPAADENHLEISSAAQQRNHVQGPMVGDAEKALSVPLTQDSWAAIAKGKHRPGDADSAFLDKIQQEKAASLPFANNAMPPILGFTLTICNKVDGQYVLRPRNLSRPSLWEVEYQLEEITDQERCWTLHRAIQSRRKKALDSEDGDEVDSAYVKQFLAKLRTLAREGKKWRRMEDKKNSQQEVVVLGRDTHGG
jgi:hypothetical protein